MNELPPGNQSIDTTSGNNNAGYWVHQQVQFTIKELRETLRDRRTIITLLAMPFLLYPLLGLGFRFLTVQQSLGEKQEYHLAFKNEAEARWLVEVLQSVEGLIETSAEDSAPPELKILTPNDETSFDMKNVVAESGADLGITIEFSEFDGGKGKVPQTTNVTLYENQGSSVSRDAAEFVQERLAVANIESIKDWASRNQLSFSVPIQQSRVVLEPAESTSAILGLLPLILLLMTVTGGVYPAIDLTAGERERATLETLMALPVSRFRLLFAKYVAVMTVIMLTGLMNLFAMSVTLYALQIDKILLGEAGFTFQLLFTLFLVLNVFALFYAAVLLLLTSSARSFKEAQAYLIPLLLLSIAPGLVILLPGWNLSNGSATIPLVNILLLSRDLLEGNVRTLPSIVAVISTILYGIAALAMAAHLFGNDAIAVGSRGSWRDLLARPAKSRSTPTITSSLTALAVLFPAYFVASGILSRDTEISPNHRLILSAMVTVLLFVGIPYLFLWHQRINLRSGLRLFKPGWLSFLTALLLGLSTWPLVFELVLFTQSLGIRGIDESQFEKVDQLLAGWKTVPTWLMVLSLGVVPGICEELFFRGYLMNGLRRHFKAIGSILFAAIAFGLFHVVLAGGAAPERLLPSTLMGILLGWIAWRSGSLIPSMLLHVVHNSSLLLVVQSRDLLDKWNQSQSQQDHLPATWLLLSLFCFLTGVTLVALLNRSKTD